MNSGQIDEDKPAEQMPKPEWLACFSGVPIWRDPNCVPRGVKIFNRAGELVAILMDVGQINIGR